MNVTYESPVSNRYKSDVSGIFSDSFKYPYWRKLWVALATSEKELGVHIDDEQIHEMQSNVYNVDMDRAAQIESLTHHDVMAHIKLFGECCPKASPIIHLGATSCFVTDNTDTKQMESGLSIIRNKLETLLHKLMQKVERYKYLECVGYTHYQRAQITTVGKRFAMWARDIMSDIERVHYEIDHLEYLGCKGAVGTLASFVSLFDGNVKKAVQLDVRVAETMGFRDKLCSITGQTYSRKQDFNVMQSLSGICQSASKFANDIRLLSSTGEIREGFEEQQIGSSAMPYKKNPITCEKMVSLCRYVMVSIQNAAITASSQWLERSLDDSANRRIVIPEVFILTCHVLEEYIKVVENLVVDEDAIKKLTAAQHANGMSEEVIMYATNHLGMNRNDVHEKIRRVTTNGGKLGVDTISDILAVPQETAEKIVLSYKVNSTGAAELQADSLLKFYETH